VASVDTRGNFRVIVHKISKLCLVYTQFRALCIRHILHTLTKNKQTPSTLAFKPKIQDIQVGFRGEERERRQLMLKYEGFWTPSNVQAVVSTHVPKFPIPPRTRHKWLGSVSLDSGTLR
jgi:hypothetical protein